MQFTTISSPNIVTGFTDKEELIKSHFSYQDCISKLGDNFEKGLIEEEDLIKAMNTADELEKGGKPAQIGEIRMFGGRQYIKMMDGWRFHGKGTGEKTKQHLENAKQHHESNKEMAKLSLAKDGRHKYEDEEGWTKYSKKNESKEDFLKRIKNKKNKESDKKLIQEHERLVDTLKSPSHKDDQKEAKPQEKELEGYKNKEATLSAFKKELTPALKKDKGDTEGKNSQKVINKYMEMEGEHDSDDLEEVIDEVLEAHEAHEGALDKFKSDLKSYNEADWHSDKTSVADTVTDKERKLKADISKMTPEQQKEALREIAATKSKQTFDSFVLHLAKNKVEEARSQSKKEEAQAIPEATKKELTTLFSTKEGDKRFMTEESAKEHLSKNPNQVLIKMPKGFFTTSPERAKQFVEKEGGEIVGKEGMESKKEDPKDSKRIGKTKSGRDIYADFEHPAHKNFTAQDHSDASDLHDSNRDDPNYILSGPQADKQSDKHYQKYSTLRKK